MSVASVISEEILLNIFSDLPPKDLLSARRVCSVWARVADDGSLYVDLAEKHSFFHRKDGPTYFADSKTAFFRFWAHKKLVKGRTLDKEKAVIPKEIDLPSPSSPFDYVANRVHLVCTLHLGVESDADTFGKIFGLACHHGDEMMVSAMAEKGEIRPWMFTLGFLCAAVLGHTHILKKLEAIGGDPEKAKLFLAAS